MLLQAATELDMVNTVSDLCTGGLSRVQVRVDGVQRSNVDYILCSPALLPLIQSMEMLDGQIGSDHKPIVLKIALRPASPDARTDRREVWKTDNIPTPPHDWSWVTACSARFREWAAHTGNVLEALRGAGLDTQCVSDMLEWSFQSSLDALAAEHLGTRWAGPRPTPTMDSAARVAAQHREVCKDIMHAVCAYEGATTEDKSAARSQYLAASRAATAAQARVRETRELALFRQVEEKQGDSKLFWSRFKQLRNSIAVNKSPPPCSRERLRRHCD